MLHTQPPSGPLFIDWGNPVTSGLALSHVLSHARRLDAVSRAVATLVGTKLVATAGGYATGFGTTIGKGTTDRISTVFARALVRRTYRGCFIRNGSGGGNLGRVFDKTNGTTGQFLYWSNTNSILTYGFYAGGSERAIEITGTGTTGAIGARCSFEISHDISGTTHTINAKINGVHVLVNSVVTAASNDAAATVLTIGNRASDSARVWDGSIEYLHVWERITGLDEGRLLAAEPYQMFLGEDDDDMVLFAPASSVAAELEASANASSSTTAALSTAISLSASGTATASATASLSTQSLLVASASTTATTSASLSTGISLASIVSAAAATSSSLTSGIKLEAGASASASSSAELSTQITLTSSSAAAAFTTAQLTVGAGLASSVVAGSTAGGELLTGISLAAAAVVAASSSAAMTTGIQLAAAAVGRASSTASLLTQSNGLESSAASASTAIASLSSGIILAAAAGANATSSSNLSTSISLMAAAVSVTSATGSLTGNGANLSGNASAVAVTSPASLSTGIQLSGGASATTITQADLLTAIFLIGDADCSASSSGTLGSLAPSVVDQSRTGTVLGRPRVGQPVTRSRRGTILSSTRNFRI